ncbi:hypothetical protein JAAARDRAFT_141671, partial [Jaapia argillacea MUCL 33604]
HGDPIHSHNIYLTPDLLHQMWETYLVRPFQIYQCLGDAIFIPAGCAHQVSNITSCIKIASNFVSPEGLNTTWSLTSEFQDENFGSQWKEDVVQLCNTCWYA